MAGYTDLRLAYLPVGMGMSTMGSKTSPGGASIQAVIRLWKNYKNQRNIVREIATIRPATIVTGIPALAKSLIVK